jgi:tetratricopeptide (TPR) repeat protein
MLAERAEGEDLERALGLAKFAVMKRRSSYAFQDTLGWVHLKLKDADSAIYAFLRATRLQPDNATYQYHLGLAYRLAGQLDKAREAFEAALELAPTPRPEWYDDARAGSSNASDGP